MTRGPIAPSSCSPPGCRRPQAQARARSLAAASASARYARTSSASVIASRSNPSEENTRASFCARLERSSAALLDRAHLQHPEDGAHLAHERFLVPLVGEAAVEAERLVVA